MIFIPITVAAAAFQVARNVFQRGLFGEAGPWGATLVRFLFGLPFALVFVAIAWVATGGGALDFSARFWISAIVGAVAQVAATAALLVSMNRSGFALGAVFQQSSLPLAAVLGLAIGEPMSALGSVGVALATIGIVILSWPKTIDGKLNWGGALAGLASGACYGVALNAYRVSTVALEPNHPMLAAVVTTAITQALQSIGLGGWLFLYRRQAWNAVMAGWKASFGAGFFGSAASALWLAALAVAPAGQVRAVGVVEMPLSALAARKLFAERLTIRQVLLSSLVALGVALAALR